LHVLLVEDHEPTRSALIRLLERRQHRVTSAETLAAARRLAAEHAFDLLISDLGLPDGDGSELMRLLASNGGPPGIALSGYGMEEDVRRAHEAGFLRHLTKPVEFGSLLATLREVLAQRAEWEKESAVKL
jgi:DNA-binding response OmpR family regulator